MSKKRVNVIIPVKNGEKFIPRCINSILNQTRKPERIIVVDDKSQDRSLEILLDYGRKYPQLITVIQGDDKGVSPARQKALNSATGDYIAFLDVDDFYHEKTIENQLKHIEKTGAVCGRMIQILPDGTYFEKEYPENDFRITYSMLKMKNSIVMSSVMIKKSILDLVGGFDEKLLRIEDYDLHLRVSRYTDYYFSKDIIVYYQTYEEKGHLEKAFIYSKWTGVVWRKHGFINLSELLRVAKYAILNIMLVPINIVIRVLFRKNRPIFRSQYLKFLYSYISGFLKGYKT